MNKFQKEYTINYFDSDKNGTAKPEVLLTYMGETSSLHSDFLGVGIDELRKNDYGWILNRWKVNFDRYPKVKDRITIETWTSGFDKFYATREFVIYDEKKEVLVKATTLWVFLNILRKRPVRIPKEYYSNYNIIEERIFDEYYQFDNSLFEESLSLDFSVRKSDIDYNEHVNNVNYLNWMLEAIPRKIDEGYKLVELDINYKNEVKFGESIISIINEGISTNEEIEYIHHIKEKYQDEINAYGRTLWQKNNSLKV